MSSKEITAEEALKFFYEMATDEENPPDMVHAMLAAVGHGWLKLVRTDNGEIAFQNSEKGMEEVQRLLRTKHGMEFVGKLKKIEGEKN